MIERELGRGGMGVVYQAFDRERNTRVALKALTQGDALNIYRLKNEFRQLSDLCHPNLVALHELSSDGEQWFFTMELIDGVTFDQYVGSGPHAPRQTDRAMHTTLAGRARLVRDASVTLSQPGIAGQFALPRISCDLTRLRSALQQLVAAIAALHDAGKLHRDVKPSNVLVTREGRVVVLDFGLVSNSTIVEPEAQDPERTIGGSVFGTPAYMSPEQATGEPVTTASDWYSVGCVLYEALTRRLPFEGSVLQILKQKEELEPVPPSSVVSGVPEDLDQLCRALLHRHPADRPPSDEVRRYFMGSSVPPPLRESLPDNRAELFIGREPHMARLRDAFELTKQGQTRVVFVHGYSGMGKTALVRCFANDLIKRSEALVLRGRCYERESVPYKAFDDIIDALSRHMMRLPTEEASELLPRNVHSLARLFPVLRRVRAVAHARLPLHQTDDPIELRNQAFGALKDLLLRLSDWQPLVINIDDLQWADMDSARLLSYLLSPPDPPPLLFVGAYRREEAGTSAFLRHILADTSLNSSRTAQLSVDPLSPDEASTLTEELLMGHPHADTELARSISAESEGVPFFIGELARHLRAQIPRWPASLEAVSLAEVITSRVDALAESSVRVLEVLSVAARPLEQGVALEAAGLPTSDRAALQELRAARMVRTRGTRQTDYAEAYHDRVREAVMSRLSSERVREIHARVARASESWGVGEPEQLVIHYAEAGEGGRAGETAIHAARAAADKLAFDRAADLYRRAIELIPAEDRVRRQGLQEQLGDALANAGRGAAAAAAYLCAAAEGSRELSVQLRCKAAQQLLRSGRYGEGFGLARDLLHAIGIECPHGRARSLASYVWTRTRLKLRGFHYDRPKRGAIPKLAEQIAVLGSLFQELSLYNPVLGATLQTRFLLHALEAGDEAAIIRGLTWEIFHLAFEGSTRSRQKARANLALLQELTARDGSAYARGSQGMALTMTLLLAEARFPEAIAAGVEAEEILRKQCKGAAYEASVVAGCRYTCLEFAGDLSQLLREAPQLARDSDERGDRHSLAVLVQALPLMYLMRDDPDGAIEFLGRQIPDHDEFSTFQYLLLVRRADVLLYQGRGTAARQHVQMHWTALTSSALYRGRMSRASAHLLRARCALMAHRESGDAEVLRDAVHDANMLAELRSGFLGFAAAIHGQLALVRGELEQAIAHFEQAMRDFSADRVDLPRLYAEYRLGQLVGGARGRKLIQEAELELARQGIENVASWIAVQLPIGLDDARANAGYVSCPPAAASGDPK